MDNSYLLFLGIASSMLAVMLYVVYEVEKWKSVKRVSIALYILGMMFTMNLGAYLYVAYHQSFYFLAINGAYMFFGLLAVLNSNEIKKQIVFPIFTSLMVASEYFMGALFYSLATGAPASFTDSIDNPWFVGVMISEMVFALSISKLNGSLKRFLISLLLLMPWFPRVFPINVVFWASSAIMIGATVLIYETLYAQRLKASQDTYTALELMVIFALMMTGGFVYFVTRSFIIYNISMILGMTWYFYRIVAGSNPKKGNYIKDPKLSFSIIFTTFIMEFFMGSVLDFVMGTFSPGISGFISSLSLPWLTPSSFISVLWDGIDIVGSVLGSVWFLIMMGVEMGFLAFKKMTEMHVRENKVRMGLMISAYALYTIYLSSFSPISPIAQYVPGMWSMGIGTLAPISGAVLIGLIGTYVIFGGLSFLFGSRNLCAVSCTAPLMYQGTFYDSLKVYNRASRFGRKTLTSKLSGWFKFVVLGVSVFVLISAIISYLHSAGIVALTVYGVDITLLIYFIWFDILWYVLFVSIPFMGTFACVTSGYCYWGTFNQAVSSVGLFRLKIRDPNQCITCKTVDCANACPVGLTDMRASFIKKGEFKSFKCVGLGECVDACPYNNIFFYDVRHWLKEKFIGKKRNNNLS
ncbi:4Fe-4S binding protein [Acidianus sp. RZ1]|uniref:4Fe-4S binding protein n=1 Tax=Acidianus sp. RZ1 TaxID=1540082 RepID=UPI001491DF36|nr:4Fe-4S binding protein [Acidianus sp. RZ1]NON61929.1 4Fe-4S dicluster domain-containing protein [Acidianus sp. RZ1]